MGGFNTFENYKNEEHLIGYWIDNKPLYRIVISQTNKNDIDISSLNYDYIEITSTTLNVNNYRRNPYYTNSSDYFRALINNSGILRIEASASSIIEWVTVLQYTKATS